MKKKKIIGTVQSEHKNLSAKNVYKFLIVEANFKFH